MIFTIKSYILIATIFTSNVKTTSKLHKLTASTKLYLLLCFSTKILVLDKHSINIIMKAKK